MPILTFQMPDKVTMETSDETKGVFVFKPLERGFGRTVGNALRRILLSSLEGYAISSVKFPSVMHEFSSIEGVQEDVTEIILNLKQVRFRKIGEEISDKVQLRVGQQHVLKAGDIANHLTGLEVLNPELEICHLNDKKQLELELTIAKGRGYVPAEEVKHEKDYGRIAIDTIFTPIRNVAYRVENTRVEQRTDYEQLSITVETDGSAHPKMALQEAAHILIKHFALFTDERMELVLDSDKDREVVDEEVLRMRKLMKMELEDLDLSVRAYNCLKAARVLTLGDIVKLELSDMMKFRNFGKKSLAELEQLVAEKNLSFGMDLTPYQLEDE